MGGFLTELRFSCRKYRSSWLQLCWCSSFLAVAAIVWLLLGGALQALQRSVPTSLPAHLGFFSVFGTTHDGRTAGFAMAHYDKLAAAGFKNQLVLYQSLPSHVQFNGADIPVQAAVVSEHFFKLLNIPLRPANQSTSQISIPSLNDLHLRHNQVIVSTRFQQQHLPQKGILLIGGQPFNIVAAVEPSFCAPDLNELCPDIWINSQQLHLVLPDSVLTRSKSKTNKQQLYQLKQQKALAYINSNFQLYGVLDAGQPLTSLASALSQQAIFSSNGQAELDGITVFSSDYQQLQQISVHSGLVKSQARYVEQKKLLWLLWVSSFLFFLFGALSLALLVSHQYQQSQDEMSLRVLLGQRWSHVFTLISTDVVVLTTLLLVFSAIMWFPLTHYLTDLPIIGSVIASVVQQMNIGFVISLVVAVVLGLFISCALLLYLSQTVVQSWIFALRMAVSQHAMLKREPTPLGMPSRSHLVNISLGFSFALLLVMGPSAVLLHAELKRAQAVSTVGTIHGIYSGFFQGVFNPAQLPDQTPQRQRLQAVGLTTELATKLPLHNVSRDLQVKQAAQAGVFVPALSNIVSDGFYSLMQIELRSGVLPQHHNEIVINQSFARQLEINPAMLHEARLIDSEGQQWRVVGIVSDLHYTDPYGAADPVVYFSAKERRDVLFYLVFATAPAHFSQLQQHDDPSLKGYAWESQQQLNDALHQNFNTLLQVLVVISVALSGVLLLVFYYSIQRLIAQKGKEPLLYVALGCPLYQIPLRLLWQTVPALSCGVGVAMVLLVYITSFTGRIGSMGWLSVFGVTCLVCLALILAIGMPLLQHLRKPLHSLFGEMPR
jgi:hypothetical protein